MMLAILLTAVLWTTPAPQLWVCNPGRRPDRTPSDCQRLRVDVLAKLWIPRP